MLDDAAVRIGLAVLAFTLVAVGTLCCWVQLRR